MSPSKSNAFQQLFVMKGPPGVLVIAKSPKLKITTYTVDLRFCQTVYHLKWSFSQKLFVSPKGASGKKVWGARKQSRGSKENCFRALMLLPASTDVYFIRFIEWSGLNEAIFNGKAFILLLVYFCGGGL